MIIAWILSCLASLATLYCAKILVVDITLADMLHGTGDRVSFVVCLVIAGGFVGLPAWLEWRLLRSRHPWWASLTAIATLALAAGAFVALAAAFTP